MRKRTAQYSLLLLLTVVVASTWLRFWDLHTRAIFFGDAARDLGVAWSALETKQLPLLGIPSSVPRFKQGPVTIWFEMAVMAVAGHNLTAVSFFFAGVSVAAVIGVFWLLDRLVSRPVAVTAAALIGFSPLAVAHGRMPYHITALPVAMVLFIWSLVRLREGKQRSLGWAILAWCGVFQFELAMAPLVLLIGYYRWLTWRQGQAWRKTEVIEVVAALVLGLAPQFIFDATHGFGQLGGFAVWVVYRLVGTTGVVGGNPFNISHIFTAGKQLELFGSRIWETSPGWWRFGFWPVTMISLWQALGVKSKTPVPSVVQVTAACMSVLLGAFIIHGSPSEAYFPPFLIGFPILISWWIWEKAGRGRAVSLVTVAIWAVVQLVSIPQSGFFVSQRSGSFQYGPGVGEQRQLIQLMKQRSPEVQLKTTDTGGEFASYFDNLRWLAAEEGLRVTDSATTIFWIEGYDSSLQSYPGARADYFPSRVIYQVPIL